MSGIEVKLISRMTNLADITEVFNSGLRSTVFEDPLSRFVFEFMMDYFQRSAMAHAPTWIVMQEEYPQVVLDHDVEETTEWLIGRLKQRYAANQAQTIIREAAKDSATDPVGSLNRMWQKAYEASQAVVPRTTFADMTANVEERRQRYNRDAADQNLRGVPLGLPEVDAHTRGIIPGELAAVGAFAKTGKSFLLSQTYVNALKAGLRPVMFTLEMDIPNIEDRIDCLYSGVSYSRMTSRSLDFQESARLRAAQDEIAALDLAPLARPERGDRTITYMATKARQLGADLLIIDQLSWIDADRSYSGDSALRMKHGELVSELKEEISRPSVGELPCLLAVQLNRQVMRGDSGGRGEMYNFANSSMVEQTCDLALGLWRNQEMAANNAMVLDIMGSRRSDRKCWTLAWHLNDRTEISVREEYVSQS